MQREPILTTLLIVTSIVVDASPNNFCGSDWTAASSDCQNRQPCPGGTDDECETGICWADTLCDTTKGDGILFDKDNPQHQRFCGNSWNDAADNCSAERHCASGDSSECPDGQACYSFLSNCNYVDMVVGTGGGGDDKEDSDEPTRLDGDSPMRSNWCGSDWNDAIAHCTDTSHWCPSGSDSDCPAGKVCFAGTDCKFVDDLYPTESPTPAPSISPTAMPLVYETIENTRFCGSGWEDAQKNCQIGRHCPNGRNSECPAGQTCFSWMSGCNILDMLDYLDTYGVEIYGADRNEMTPSGDSGGSVPIDSTTGFGESSSSWPAADTDSESTTGVPPSLSLGVWTPQPAPIEQTPPSMWTAAPAESSLSESPAETPSDGFYPEHHVFCGESWFDAQSKCSEETFCSDGAASHVCENERDYCWVGITACDAGEWLLVKETPALEMTSLAPGVTPVPIDSGALEDESSSAPIEVLQSPTPTMENVRSFPTFTPSFTTEIATNAPAGLTISEVLQSPTPTIESGRSSLTFTPSSTTEIATNAPDDSAILDSEATTGELDRFSIKQSFCAENYIHLIQECATLDTCNKSPCPDGLTCFKNVLCDRPTNTSPESTIVEVNESPAPIVHGTATSPPSSSPVAVTDSPTITQVNPSPETQEPSQQPTIFVLAEDEVAQRMSTPNNYCAKSLQEILSTCSYALKTCNADDPMCGLGTNCFGNIICPSPTNAPTTKPPVSVPVLTTTLEPISVAVEDAAFQNPAAQSYCAESEDLVQSTCATGFTCNEGPHTCPFGTSCFSNVVCEALQSENGSSELATTIAPIIKSPQENEFTGNYCAESEDMIQSTCEEALVCNDGFGTCPFGTYCFSNVVCKALQVQSTMEECKDFCLKPIEQRDCEYILSLELNILPCTGVSTQYEQETSMDQVCSGTGRCGTSSEPSNCDISQSLYMRVDVSNCIDAGLGRSGVITSESSHTLPTPASIVEPAALVDTTYAPSITPPAEPTAENTKEETNEPIVYSWNDPPNNATRENQVDNQAEIDSWWIMQEESGAAGSSVHFSIVFVGMLFTITCVI